jgi:hypothetical protein
MKGNEKGAVRAFLVLVLVLVDASGELVMMIGWKMDMNVNVKGSASI